MYQLNLPEFEYTLKKADGKVLIFDVIRKKYVTLTPEEWVRQHFIHYLINHLHYPKTLMSAESGLTYNTLSKRTDLVVFDRGGNPWMLIECKSPELKLSRATLEQASAYNTTKRASYLVITNGLQHLCAKIDWQLGQTTQLDQIPEYPHQ